MSQTLCRGQEDVLLTGNVPMGEVKYRLVVCACRRRADRDRAVDVAHERGLWAGSSRLGGIARVVLLATPGEASAYCSALAEAGISAEVIGEEDAPRRPQSWRQPVRRPNWPWDSCRLAEPTRTN